MGWERLSNSALLKAAEEASFSLLLGTDQSIRYQQNLTDRKIAIIILGGCTKWSRVRLHFERIAAAVNAVTPGSYAEVYIPFTLNPASPPPLV
jgi:aconitase A